MQEALKYFYIKFFKVKRQMKVMTAIIFLLLSSCMYVEGQIIEEPKDIKIRDCLYRFAYWERCATIDVTEKNHKN